MRRIPCLLLAVLMSGSLFAVLRGFVWVTAIVDPQEAARNRYGLFLFVVLFFLLDHGAVRSNEADLVDPDDLGGRGVLFEGHDEVVWHAMSEVTGLGDING
ncbi:MAG TPA: hypothetical protein VK116_18680, partial [Planctomycetota bacterium]|nr:hypothetical protein [Planctomycetota bacterium]